MCCFGETCECQPISRGTVHLPRTRLYCYPSNAPLHILHTSFKRNIVLGGSNAECKTEHESNLNAMAQKGGPSGRYDILQDPSIARETHSAAYWGGSEGDAKPKFSYVKLRSRVRLRSTCPSRSSGSRSLITVSLGTSAFPNGYVPRFSDSEGCV